MVGAQTAARPPQQPQQEPGDQQKLLSIKPLLWTGKQAELQLLRGEAVRSDLSPTAPCVSADPLGHTAGL